MEKFKIEIPKRDWRGKVIPGEFKEPVKIKLQAVRPGWIELIVNAAKKKAKRKRSKNI